MRISGFLGLIVLLLSAHAVQAEQTLRVGDQKGLQKALLDASHALDGASYRIDWSEFPAASPLLQALGADAVDTGIAGDGPFLFAYGAGQDVRATMAVLPRDGGHLVAVVVPAGSPIHTVADLAGHVVATTRGSIGHNLVLRLVETGAIPRAGVTTAFLSPAQAQAALDSGSVDAWSTWEPYIALEEQKGARRIVDGHDILANYGFQVASVHAIQTKHIVLQDFYRRLARAYDWGNAHPDQYAKIWSIQVGLPLDISSKVADTMRTHSGPVDANVVDAERATIATYRKAGALPAVGPDIALAFDHSFSSQPSP